MPYASYGIAFHAVQTKRYVSDPDANYESTDLTFDLGRFMLPPSADAAGAPPAAQTRLSITCANCSKPFAIKV